MVGMRVAPLLAAIVCVILSGSAASAGAMSAAHAAGPRSMHALTAPAIPVVTAVPSATPAPTAAATPSPGPAPPAGLVDVAARSECGIPDGTVPASGRQIVISLACQELSAYQDGTPVLSTLVTTGRPALPTPTGHYSVLSRSSGYRMVSSWRYGTIGWYPPSWVTWVLWFRSDGYGIHDASWRSAYGPGTEASGSHGCVNVPHAGMRTLYAWAVTGTTVDIY
jgi:lipoprotein-anchoring transpeptidase ErfK/SrfK